MIHTHALESGSVCQNIEIYILAAVLSFKTSLCEQINPVLHPSAPRPSSKERFNTWKSRGSPPLPPVFILLSWY